MIMTTVAKNVSSGIIVLLFLTLIWGCSASHYTQEEADVVKLYYKNPGAKKVYFASSIDRYRYHPAQTEDNEIWVVTVRAKRDFSYFYIVDGTVALPDCPLMVRDDFGSYNCLYLYNM